MHILNLIINIYSFLLYLKPTNYYYYNCNKGNYMNITIIVNFLNFILVGIFIKNYIFENNIICEKDDKMWLYSKNIKTCSTSKIIKNIYYKDDNLNIQVNELKKNIYNIDSNISLPFILYYYKKIIVNDKSYLELIYYNNDSKYVKVHKTSKFNQLF